MKLQKIDTIRAMVDNGVVAVIRADSVEMAVKMAKAAAKGGIKGLEITFTVPHADQVIEQLTADNEYDYIVGAGTVLDAATARLAIIDGARFIVSPSFNAEVAEICNLYQVPYCAGCLTPKEIETALRAGVDLIKVFPGSAVGPDYFKAIHGPFPQANLLPSGGVSAENAGEWIKAGAVAVSAGGSLTAPAKKGDFEQISKNAAVFVEEVRKARGE